MAQPSRGGSPRTTIIVVASLVILVAACSGGASSPASTVAGPTPAATATPAPSVAAPAPTGPSTFQLTVAGDPNVTGTWGASFGTTCFNPGYDGLTIYFFAASPDQKAVVLISLSSGSIGVSERAGAAATYTDREFKGTGVTTFDPTKGATFDSDLSQVPGATSPGTLGTITHVAGSVDCGGVTAGTSTISVDGTMTVGQVKGTLAPVRVACTRSAANGDSVSVVGIVASGPVPSSINLSLRLKGSTIFAIPKGGQATAFFNIDPAGVVTLTATGAHVDAGFTQQLPAGSTATPLKFHAVGDATCGSTVTN